MEEKGLAAAVQLLHQGSISSTLLTPIYQYTQLEVTPNFSHYTLYAVPHLDQHKSTDAKSAHRMLMILRPGVNFINIICAAFAKSTKQHC